MLTVEIEQKQTIDDEHPAYGFDLELGLVRERARCARARRRRRAAARASGGYGARRPRAKRVVRDRAAPAKPALVRIDPRRGSLGRFTLALGTEMPRRSCAATRVRWRGSAPRARWARTARAPPARRSRAALRTEPFWGVAVEIAAVLGRTRGRRIARDALLDGARAPAPEGADARSPTRSARIATPVVADALLGLRADAVVLRRRERATRALGKTRDPRAFDALVAALERAVVERNDRRRRRARPGRARRRRVRSSRSSRRSRASGPRRCGAPPSVRWRGLGTLVDAVRTAVVDAVERALEDPAYLVRRIGLRRVREAGRRAAVAGPRSARARPRTRRPFAARRRGGGDPHSRRGEGAGRGRAAARRGRPACATISTACATASSPAQA